MPVTEEELRTVRSRISNRQSSRAQSIVMRDAAKAKVAEAREMLKDEFEVVTNDDARAKLAELDAALVSAVETVKTKLTEAGA